MTPLPENQPALWTPHDLRARQCIRCSDPAVRCTECGYHHHSTCYCPAVERNRQEALRRSPPQRARSSFRRGGVIAGLLATLLLSSCTGRVEVAIGDQGEETASPAWESIGGQWSSMKRARTPTGWLVKTTGTHAAGLTHVPDPEHKWLAGTEKVGGAR